MCNLSNGYKLLILLIAAVLCLSMAYGDTFSSSLDNELIVYHGFNETSGTYVSNAKNILNNGTALIGGLNGTLGIRGSGFYQAKTATVSLEFKNYSAFISSFATTNLSYSFWINKQSAGDDGNELFFQKPVSGAVTGIGCSDGPGATEISCGFYQGGVGWNRVGINNLNIDEWYHVYVSYDSNTNNIKVYRNNILKGNVGFSLSDTVETNYIKFDQAGGEIHSNNIIDEFAIWTRSLNDSELVLLNSSFYETSAIALAAPNISIYNVITDLENIILGAGHNLIEYSANLWYWNFTITEHNNTWNYTNASMIFYNKSNNIIFNISNITRANQAAITLDKLFLIYSDNMPYSANLTISDNTGYTATTGILFNVTDTSMPTITSTLLANTTIIYRGDNLNFSFLFQDEALFQTEVILYLSNGTEIYSDIVTNANTVTYYNLTDSLAAINYTGFGIIYGNATARDGHTAANVEAALKSKVLKVSNQIIQSDCFSYELLEVVDKLDMLYNADRAFYKATYNKAALNMQIRITPICEPVNVLYTEKYGNYMVIGNYWIDFMADGLITSFIKSENGSYLITQYFNAPQTSIETKSIGIINEITRDFHITLSDRPVPIITTATLEGIFFLMFLLLFYVAFIVLGIWSKIPILSFFAGIIGFITGIAAFMFIPSAYLMNYFLSTIWMLSGLMLWAVFFMKMRYFK